MGGAARPVALDFGGDCADWRSWRWFDARDGEPIVVTTNPIDADRFHGRGRVVVLDTLADQAAAWARRSSWPLPEVIVRDPVCVLAVGRAGARYLAGRTDTVRGGGDGAAMLVEAARRLGPTRFAHLTGIPLRNAKRYVAGNARPQAQTIARVRNALRDALGRGSLVLALDVADEPRACETEGGCPYGEIVAGRARFCRRCRMARRALRERERRKAERLSWSSESFVLCAEIDCDVSIMGGDARAAARRSGWTGVAGRWHCPAHAPPAALTLCSRCGERRAAGGVTLCAVCLRPPRASPS